MSKQTELQPREAPPVSASATTTTARMSGEERRMEIVRVAMRLFSRRGFRGTTTKEIAQAAGVSEAIIFRHFATKHELYAAIIDHKACAGGFGDPREMVADAIRRKDDRAVFEDLAFAALQHHEKDTEFNRLLLYAALEGHELAHMFWERTVLQLYQFLGSYIGERQRDGAIREIDPLIVVRAFVGMIIHHSLNNNLWDPQRRLLNITNQRAAREFTEILLRGIAADDASVDPRVSSSSRSSETGRKRAVTLTSRATNKKR